MLMIKRMMLLALLFAGLPGCTPANSSTYWAGQPILKDWQNYIDGKRIETGYRSPMGLFEVRFPLSPHSIVVRDFIDKGGTQPWKTNILEYAIFQDMYGYYGDITVMLTESMPAYETIDYEWLDKNLPDGWGMKPDNEYMLTGPGQIQWRVFTFGPSEMEGDFFGFRMEALTSYKQAVYRIISHNHIIPQFLRESVKLSDDVAKQMAEESTRKNFNILLENLVLKGLPDVDEKTTEPSTQAP